MEPIKFFDSMEHLEPKCPNCSTIIEYGITTEWDDKAGAHVCNKCGAAIK